MLVHVSRRSIAQRSAATALLSLRARSSRLDVRHPRGNEGKALNKIETLLAELRDAKEKATHVGDDNDDWYLALLEQSHDTQNGNRVGLFIRTLEILAAVVITLMIARQIRILF